MNSNKEVPVLLTSVLIIAICGILYELLISSVSTYFLGSSIFHFSITIGLFLSAMGIGSFLTRFITKNLLSVFINVEILLGLIGGISALLLHLSFSFTDNYYVTAFSLIIILGTLIGIEIPVLTRILKSYDSLKDTISNVLAFDYIGSLLASVLFPIILLPYLGVMRVAFLVGIINIMIGVVNILVFRDKLQKPMQKVTIAVFLCCALFIGFLYSFQISGLLEQMVYADNIIFSKQSKYQRIVVTKYNNDTRLYINGNLQFSTIDEYRYHEPLVHVPMSFVQNAENILLLGAGDGLAIKELIKYDGLQSIDLVDLDPVITEIAAENPIFTSINNNSLSHPTVNIINKDAFNFVKNSNKIYSLIIVDLPDPNSPGLGKLYSKEFYMLLDKILAQDGVVVTQSTSPYFATKAFWCINKTMDAVFESIIPYNSYLPTFGIWGFNMGFKVKQKPFYEAGVLQNENVINHLEKHIGKHKNRLQNRYLVEDILPKLFIFEKDMKDQNVEVNKVDNQVLVKYYEKSWGKWN